MRVTACLAPNKARKRQLILYSLGLLPHASAIFCGGTYEISAGSILSHPRFWYGWRRSFCSRRCSRGNSTSLFHRQSVCRQSRLRLCPRRHQRKHGLGPSRQPPAPADLWGATFAWSTGPCARTACRSGTRSGDRGPRTCTHGTRCCRAGTNGSGPDHSPNPDYASQPAGAAGTVCTSAPTNRRGPGSGRGAPGGAASPCSTRIGSATASSGL